MSKYMEKAIDQYKRRLEAEPNDHIRLFFLTLVDKDEEVYYTSNINPSDLPEFVKDLKDIVEEVESVHYFQPKGKTMPTVTIPKERVSEVLDMINKRNAEELWGYASGKVMFMGILNARTVADGLLCNLSFRRYSPPPELEQDAPPLVDMSYIAELVPNKATYVP